jgi:hypothetical protein
MVNKISAKEETFWLGENNSYEIRFYCNLCDEEIEEQDQEEHECEEYES